MSEEMENANAEEQMIDFKCPYCSESVSFPEMDAGTLQECPFCLEVIIVPRQSCEVGGKVPLPIATARLQVRRLVEDDSNEVSQMMADEKLLRYTGYSRMDETRVFQWLKSDSKEHFNLRAGYYWFGIALRETDKLVGMANIYYVDETRRQLQVIVFIMPGEQRKGFGEEAVRGLLEFGFRGLNMHRMCAFCDSRDTAFMGLAVKIGLRQEGAFFEDRFVKGEWVNTAYYAILQSEFEAASEKGSVSKE